MSLDVLAVGPHPDDAELGVGGTLALLARRGKAVGILDLTRGELSSRGTPEERDAEAQDAATILGLRQRVQAGLPDGGIENNAAQRLTVISVLRRLRPRVLILPAAPDRHPDHVAANALLLDTNFLAGLAKIDDGLPPHRAATVLQYHPYAQQEAQPTFVQDITPAFETKLDALRAYQSQFHNPDYTGPETLVSSEAFWRNIRVRAQYWGARISVTYGEPLYVPLPLPLDIVQDFLR